MAVKKKVDKKVKKAINFMNDGIWKIDMEELSRAKARFIHYLQVALVTIKTYTNEKIGFQATALSFHCTMAIVPFIAIAFAVTGGLGISDKLRILLYENFSTHQDVIDTVLSYADNIINIAKSSTMGLISAIMFVWVVVWMMMRVETVFNNVWMVKKPRRITRQIPYYIVILMISPLLIMMFFSGTMMYSHMFEGFGRRWAMFSELPRIIYWIIFYIIGSFTLSAMYKFIPNTKVKYEHALRAALMSGLAFTILQYLYLETQIFVGRQSAVYGTLAAIPLFMFWLKSGWMIILIGAEVSYAFQQVKEINGVPVTDDGQKKKKKPNLPDNEEETDTEL